MRGRPRRAGDGGASSIEYAILVTLIAVVVIAAVFLVGRQVKDDFDCTNDAIYNAPDGCPSG